MKSKTTGLVVLVVLFSSFCHGRYQSKKSEKVTTKEAVTSSNENCGLQLIINSTTNFVAFVNVTAAAARVFDVKNSYTAMFFGNTGTVILIDLQSKCGLFIAGNCSHVGWFIKSQTFDKYFKSLSTLKSMYECNKKYGEKFTTYNVSTDILLEMKLFEIALSRNQYYITRDGVLEDLIRTSTEFVESLNGPLNGALNILGSGVRTVKISIKSVIIKLHSIGEVFCRVKRGMSVLADLNLDWNWFLNTQAWNTVSYTLLSKLKEHGVDVNFVLSPYKNNPPFLFSGLSGNFTAGSSGVLHIIAEASNIILGKRSADYLIDVLLQYYTHSASNGVTYEQYIKEILPFIDLYKKIGVAELLKNPISEKRGLQKRHLIEKGVDLYKIVSITFEKTKLPLQSIVKILTKVKNLANIDSSIAFLLYRLISLVVDRSDNEIVKLIPAIKINCSMDFLDYVFRGAKVSDLQGNFYEFLHSRPVIGQILDVIDSSLKACNDKSSREMIESPGFCKYHCLMIKMIEKVIEELNRKCENGQESDSRHLGVLVKQLVVGNKQLKGKHFTHQRNEKHYERFNGKVHKERHERKELGAYGMQRREHGNKYT